METDILTKILIETGVLNNETYKGFYNETDERISESSSQLLNKCSEETERKTIKGLFESLCFILINITYFSKVLFDKLSKTQKL